VCCTGGRESLPHKIIPRFAFLAHVIQFGEPSRKTHAPRVAVVYFQTDQLVARPSVILGFGFGPQTRSDASDDFPTRSPDISEIATDGSMRSGPLSVTLARSPGEPISAGSADLSTRHSPPANSVPESNVTLRVGNTDLAIHLTAARFWSREVTATRTFPPNLLPVTGSAHNPKLAGSNPAPATNLNRLTSQHLRWPLQFSARLENTRN